MRCSLFRNHFRYRARVARAPHRRRAGPRDVGEFGPAPPPIPDIDSEGAGAYDLADDGKPMWLKDLERDVDYDPEVKQLLDGAEDPEVVRARMTEYVQNSDQYSVRDKTGRPDRVQVSFREYDPAVAYFWLELYKPPTEDDVGVIEQAISSWFIVGKLGGFNSMNLQVHNAASNDVSFMPYEQGTAEDVKAYFHELGDLERQGTWLRFRVDLGTGDEVGLDILINTLQGLSEEYVGIKQLIIGGENEDWPVEDGMKPEVAFSPMRPQEPGRADVPDLEDMDEESDGETMAEILEEIKTRHPEKYDRLQQMEDQMRNLDEL